MGGLTQIVIIEQSKGPAIPVICKNVDFRIS